MTLLKIGTHEFTSIASEGYEINEKMPVVLAEITTASGYKRQSLAPKTKTIIQITTTPGDENAIAADRAALVSGTYIYWSMEEKKLKQASFIVEKQSVKMISSVGNKLIDGFQATLEQNGDSTDYVG